jgi:hypothetical protein
VVSVCPGSFQELLGQTDKQTNTTVALIYIIAQYLTYTRDYGALKVKVDVVA